MTQLDLNLSAAAVLTMDAARRVIPDGALAIARGGIVAVGPRAAMLAAYPGAPHRAMPGRVVMPGPVNAHAHSGMLCSTAAHMAVWDWLTCHVNPMHRALRPEEAEAALYPAYAESLLSGVTTVVDMWRFMDGSARAAEVLGNRLVAAPHVVCHPDYDHFDTLDLNGAQIETLHCGAGGRVQVRVGLEHLFHADEAGRRRAADLAKRTAPDPHPLFRDRDRGRRVPRAPRQAPDTGD